jgi:UDPglucose 6-dehydrogenase
MIPPYGELPPALATVERADTPITAARAAHAIVVATEWPEYRRVTPDEVLAVVSRPLIVDPNRFLGATLGADARIQLISVGQPA